MSGFRRRISSAAGAVLAACLVLSAAGGAQAAVIPVPAGGDLQAALNNAQAGDTIVLQPGATYIGNFILPNKAGSSYITATTSAAGLPGDGARISPASAPLLAKLRSPNNGGSALQTAAGAHHWRLVLLEFLSADGAGDIITLGDGAQTSLAVVPHDLIADRLYVHAGPGTPQKRGIALNSASTTVTGSYMVRSDRPSPSKSLAPASDRRVRRGDIIADARLYRPSTRVWLILPSSTNFTVPASFQWGVPGMCRSSGARDRSAVAGGTGKGSMECGVPSLDSTR